MSASVEADAAALTAQGIRELVDWAFAERQPAIPVGARRKAALALANNIGATIAAQDETEVARIRVALLAQGCRSEATVLSDGLPRTDRMSAVIANGIAGCWCELDEGYRLAPCHAGLYVISVLLAEAEVSGATVGAVIDRLVIAYEVAARIARCWRFPQMTLHPHAQLAAIGGAIALAVSRDFRPATAHAALTSACTLVNVGSYSEAVHGALVRNTWAAIGASNGMRAAEWAALGIAGLPTSPYEVFTNRLGQPPAPSALTSALGEEWAVANGFHKIHSCCQSTHSAIEAALQARAILPAGTSHADVDHVSLETHRPSMTNPNPETTLAARFSLDHAIASAIVYGHADVDAFNNASLVDPNVARLRTRVRISAFEGALTPPNDRPARVKLHLSNGQTIAAECLSASGGPDRPFDVDVIHNKIDRLAGRMPRLADALKQLDGLAPSLLSRRWTDVIASERTTTA